MKPEIHLDVPGGVKNVLLHCCCAPCSSAIVECLLDNGVCPTLFFCNPNIYPREEYERRKAECIRHAGRLGLDFVDADYDHDGWVAEMRGLENEPERGARCLRCFTSTLASSRWKDLNQINEAGRAAAIEVPGVDFWEQNWRKGGLQERRRELIAEYCFYNQTYCGCEYSLRAAEAYAVSKTAGK